MPTYVIYRLLILILTILQLVCRRAKFHFEDDVHDIDTDNASIRSGEGPHIDFYKQHFTAINERMKDTMYFV
jgi:eukaryotic translation initiation factor 2C